MAETPQQTGGTAPEAGDGSSPFYAANYHFGMLLGVDDFETEQAYHRGKMRLHNAWLHRAGVVWGFGVRIDQAHGELRVLPGLAVDGCGRELHLDADRCVNVGKWFEQRRADPALAGAVAGGRATFDAHVAVRFVRCLARPVPALAEPCEGATSETAYSRVFETVELLLLPGLAPAHRQPFHRVRLLFGLDAPLEDAGAIVAADREVLEERAHILALPPGARPAATADAFRRFAALDGARLTPAQPESGAGGWLYPSAGDDALALADVRGIALDQTAAGWTLAGGQVDMTVRQSLLPAAVAAELACAAGPGATALGPRALPPTFSGINVTLAFDTDLSEPSVSPSAFAVSWLEDTGWHGAAVTDAQYDAAARSVTLTLDAVPGGHLVRVIARGTGETPLVGLDYAPLGGGTDFVYTEKRS